MKRGFTLIELIIILAVAGIAISLVVTNVATFREKQRCARGEYVPTGAQVCTRHNTQGGCDRYEPEKNYVCYEYKAEATP